MSHWIDVPREVKLHKSERLGLIKVKCELFVSYYNTNRTLILSLVNCNKLDCLATVRAVVPQVLPFFPISRSSRSATGCAVDAYSCSVEKMVCGVCFFYLLLQTCLWGWLLTSRLTTRHIKLSVIDTLSPWGRSLPPSPSASCRSSPSPWKPYQLKSSGAPLGPETITGTIVIVKAGFYCEDWSLPIVLLIDPWRTSLGPKSR